VPNGQKAVELILARNLLSTLTTPGFLVDEEGNLVFYNEAAGVLLGRRFEEAGKMGPEEWGATWGPFARDGDPIPLEELPLTIALRHGRPAYSTFTIRSLEGGEHAIEAAALPIVNTEGTRGAMVFFWTEGKS
jgi:PAS domain-containing protein